jgi:hypothetical protein
MIGAAAPARKPRGGPDRGSRPHASPPAGRRHYNRIQRLPVGAEHRGEKDMTRLKRGVAALLVASTAYGGFAHTAQATLIGTEQVAEAARSAGRAADDRARIDAALARADVREQLQRLGVTPEQARERAAALTDEEAARLAGTLDSAPAGGIIGAIVFIFVLLLVTDILGFTKVYPFTRSIR